MASISTWTSDAVRMAPPDKTKPRITVSDRGSFGPDMQDPQPYSGTGRALASTVDYGVSPCRGLMPRFSGPVGATPAATS